MYSVSEENVDFSYIKIYILLWHTVFEDYNIDSKVSSRYDPNP